MKYLFLIIFLILSLFIFYKIITPYPYPSKYFETNNSKWHFFSKDKKIIKYISFPSFLIKSIHITGDFNEIKGIELQSFVPFFFFKFININGFSLQKTPYGVCFFKEKGIFFDLSEEEESFGWIKTNPRINFKIIKNKFFEFESKVNLKAEERYFNLKKDFDFEVYKAKSPHFELLFPKIEDIEIYFKKDFGYLRLKKNNKTREIKFGDFEIIKFKDEKFSFYLKLNDSKILKNYFKNPFFEKLLSAEIECKGENNTEKCKGIFALNF